MHYEWLTNSEHFHFLLKIASSLYGHHSGNDPECSLSKKQSCFDSESIGLVGAGSSVSCGLFNILLRVDDHSQNKGGGSLAQRIPGNAGLSCFYPLI